MLYRITKIVPLQIIDSCSWPLYTKPLVAIQHERPGPYVYLHKMLQPEDRNVSELVSVEQYLRFNRNYSKGFKLNICMKYVHFKKKNAKIRFR